MLHNTYSIFIGFCRHIITDEYHTWDLYSEDEYFAQTAITIKVNVTVYKELFLELASCHVTIVTRALIIRSV